MYVYSSFSMVCFITEMQNGLVNYILAVVLVNCVQ